MGRYILIILIVVAFISDVVAGDFVHRAMPRQIGAGVDHQRSIESRAHPARPDLETLRDQTSLSMLVEPPQMSNGDFVCHPCCTVSKTYCPALVPSVFDATGRALTAARTGAPNHKLMSWQPPPPKHPPNLVV